MANETPLRDPAYQLFFQEALELLLQIDTTLQEVLQIPSKTSIDFLLEMTQILYEGAQSLNLTQLAHQVQAFSSLMLNLQQDPLGTTPEDAYQLRQAYKEMQTALEAYISGPPVLDMSSNLDASSVRESSSHGSIALDVAEDELATNGNLMLPAGGSDVTSLILISDVAEILDQLQQVLVNPQVFDLAAELKALTEALLGWGEVLELNELTTIAQSTLDMLDSNPQSAISIGQLSLAGFRAAHKTALQALQADSGSQNADHHPQSSKKLDLPSSPTAMSPMAAEIPTAESLSASDEVILNATQLFVWQQERLLFTIPSEAVAEILIPRAEQLMGNEHQRCLSWQQQFIPIHPLGHLLNRGESHWPRLTAAVLPGRGANSATVFGSSPLIIIHQGGQTLALEVEITRLVTESELVLQIPEGQIHCPYFSGETALESEQYAVVDIAALLNEMLNLSPLPMPKAVRLSSPAVSVSPKPKRPPKVPKKTRSQTTILVVDDSKMVRMMVSTALQSAGYDVLEAADGQLAIEQVERADIQLIICDVEMPNMNGFEFLEYRCRQPAIMNLPVVMLSTCNSDQHRQLATTLGANAYLTKPYDESNLLATLQALVG